MASLPPHTEVPDALQSLRNGGLRLVTLTNSSQRASSINKSGRSTGPVLPAQFFGRYRTSVQGGPRSLSKGGCGDGRRDLRSKNGRRTCLGIVGAMQAGCAGAFISRPGKVIFPLGPQPDVEGPDLSTVARHILERER